MLLVPLKATPKPITNMCNLRQHDEMPRGNGKPSGSFTLSYQEKADCQHAGGIMGYRGEH